MSIETHDIEIDKKPAGTILGQFEFRVSCSCGFLGPWRRSRSSTYRDRDAHEERMAEAES